MSTENNPEADDLSDLIGIDDDAIPTTERDEDEREAADVLEVDQTELEELGLTLDDPHQPDDE
jgi:hypothetical protein